MCSLGSLTVIYFVGGCLINKYHYQKEGIEEIMPHYSFWAALPGLVKDGNVYTYNKLQDIISSCKS